MVARRRPSAPGAEGEEDEGGSAGEEEAVEMAAGRGGADRSGGEVGGAAPGSPPPNARRHARAAYSCARRLLPTRCVHGMAVGIRVRRWERQRAWGQGQGPGQLSFSKFRRLFGIGIIVEIAGGAFRAGAASGSVANVLDRSLSLGTCAF